MTAPAAKPDRPPTPTVGIAEFLEAFAPGSQAIIRDLIEPGAGPGRWPSWAGPDIQLHCDSDTCSGKRIFEAMSGAGNPSNATDWQRVFMVYRCRNCQQRQKTFALLVKRTGDVMGVAYKIGEVPSFGPPVPARVIALIGPNRELFLRGRRAENQGLGIGAFAYYRRVVENNWQHLIGEIIQVAERIGARKAILETPKKAQSELKFSKAVDDIKDALPDLLLIRGHNPLTLLHKALSEGLHEESEDRCLELASSIRLVLTELAERIGEALKDEAELRDAVSRLLTRRKIQKEASRKPRKSQWPRESSSDAGSFRAPPTL